MAFYENVFVVRQDVASTQVEALADTYATLIQENGGTVTKKEFWGLKGLAFKIKKNRKAHYAFFNIEAPPAAVAEMERRMGINGDIIRFLTVRVEGLEAEPSVMMRKQDREDRPERGGFGGGRGFGGPRGDRPPREGGFRGGDRGGDGGSTFRARPPREGGERPPRDGAPRGPRPPRDSNPGSEG